MIQDFSLGKPLKSLLEISPRSELESFIPSQTVLGIFTKPDVYLKKEIEAKINDWTWEVIREMFESKFGGMRFLQLKLVVDEIIKKHSIEILKEVIEKRDLLDERIKKLITRLLASFRWVKSIQLPPVAQPPAVSKPIIISQNRATEDIVLAQFKRFSPSAQENWNAHMIKAFEELSKPIEVKAAIKELDLTQLVVLFHHLTEKDNNLWKIACSLNAIPAENVVSLLKFLDEGEILAMNRQFLKLPTEDFETLNSTFELWRKQVVASCNLVEDEINKQAELYREINILDIRKKDLESIVDLQKKVEVIKVLSRKFAVVINNLPLDKETVHISCDLNKVCQGLIERLLADKDEVAGNLLGILNRRAFGYFDEDDDAIEIFGSWNIKDQNNYLAVGLIDKIEPESKDGFMKGVETLKTFGIKKIFELKKLQIYNKTLLKEYINERRKSKLHSP